MQDSIIVYRNPAEKYLWENAGTVFPQILLFVVVFFSVFGLVYWAVTKIPACTRDGNVCSVVAGIAGFVSACAAVWFWG
jgi:hypothetical protein